MNPEQLNWSPSSFEKRRNGLLLGGALTAAASANFRTITAEFERRLEIGLATRDTLSSPGIAVGRYLAALDRAFPSESAFVETLLRQADTPICVRPLMVVVPVAAFRGQEPQCIERFISALRADSAAQRNQVAVVVFANRPPGEVPDQTTELFRTAARRSGLPLTVIDGAVPTSLGRSYSPLLGTQCGEGVGRAPIALIRDVLNIAVMKAWALEGCRGEPPVVVQMDVDFEGFARGGLDTVLSRFRANPALRFLQATSSFDDATYRTHSLPQLALGDALMRELPLLLKRSLGDVSLSFNSSLELLFGEVIQRGIQVAQSERIDSIAQRGGYGLVRMPEDELDANIRLAWVAGPSEGVQSADEVIFKWNSRRAILAYERFGAPPIAQWAVKFTADDSARREDQVAYSATQIGLRLVNGAMASEEALSVINRTLARFPLPTEIPGIYANPTELIVRGLQKCGAQREWFDLSFANDGTERVRASLTRFDPSQEFLSGSGFTENTV